MEKKIILKLHSFPRIPLFLNMERLIGPNNDLTPEMKLIIQRSVGSFLLSTLGTDIWAAFTTKPATSRQFYLQKFLPAENSYLKTITKQNKQLNWQLLLLPYVKVVSFTNLNYKVGQKVIYTMLNWLISIYFDESNTTVIRLLFRVIWRLFNEYISIYFLPLLSSS